ncbi:Rieske (2Fe-2S) protein [Streptomyces sp. NPDC012461]|jgi:Rieske Fe-S protein|uniref:Rieske (2Fe-2S) protein n=1 Tax=unclassified Streptomyces TaxID=2593676 RepID=UPI0033CCA9DC
MTHDATRRTVLVTAGAAGAAALAAACGGGGGDGGDTGSATVTSTSGPDAPGGRELVPAGDVPVGGGTVLKDEKIVVTQPTAGEFKAFSAVCTHQHCLVSTVADGAIDCPCHGSRFRITDGSVERGPATQPLPEERITVDGNSIRTA